LQKDVYFNQSIPELRPQGYTVYSNPRGSGIVLSSNNGYFARMYRKGDTIYLVNRGTNKGHALGTNSDADANWETMGGGLSAQHRLAADNAQRLVTYADRNGLRVHFVGHSLGGSFASLQSVITGRSATTFNASNLEVETVERYINAGRLQFRTVGFGRTARRELIISERARTMYATHTDLIGYYYVNGDSVHGSLGRTHTILGSPTRLAYTEHPIGQARTVRVGGVNDEISRPRVVYDHHNPSAHSMNAVLYSLHGRFDRFVP
jgi:hypothetical protein